MKNHIHTVDFIHAPAEVFIQATEQYTNNLYEQLNTTPNIQNIIKDIQQQAYHEIDAVLEHNDFVLAAQKFEEFLALSQETKDKFAVKVNTKKGFDAGYIQKSRSKGDTDNKEYFHYNLYTEKHLADIIQQYPQAKEFILSARKIYIGSLVQIATILKAREQQYPGIYKLFIQQGHDPHFFMRFLMYDINPEDDNKKDFAAKGHYDRGSMTIAHAESHAGLRIGSDEENLKAIQHQEGKAKYFLSGYFPRIIINHYPETLNHEQKKLLQDPQKIDELIKSINNNMPLGFHDVIQNRQSNIDKKRRAIVSFFDAIHEDELSYEQTHRPIK